MDWNRLIGGHGKDYGGRWAERKHRGQIRREERTKAGRGTTGMNKILGSGDEPKGKSSDEEMGITLRKLPSQEKGSVKSMGGASAVKGIQEIRQVGNRRSEGAPMSMEKSRRRGK